MQPGKAAVSNNKQLASRQLFERATLFTVALLASSVLTFLALASLVMRSSTVDFDSAVLLMMRNPADLADPVGPIWFEELMRDVTGLGGVGLLTFITLAGAGFLALGGSLRNSIALILAVGSGVMLSSLLKYGFGRLWHANIHVQLSKRPRLHGGHGLPDRGHHAGAKIRAAASAHIHLGHFDPRHPRRGGKSNLPRCPLADRRDRRLVDWCRLGPVVRDPDGKDKGGLRRAVQGFG